jgi:serine/threonine-protein kinase
VIGRTVSHYVIRERLGGGGMGVVYRADDTRLGRPVALKFLPAELTDDPVARERFVLEARAASAIDHPHLCTVHEIDETPEGLVFICMAYYPGETLRDRIARGPLPVSDALVIAIQIAEGLQAAHVRGVVHRDVKPANVILTADGAVKIVDFGLATLVGRARLTRTGTTVGTAVYMSPEQAQGHPVDRRTDLWSLGIVLHEMLTGRPPFVSDSDQAVIHSILHATPPPVSSLRADVPPQLDAVVARCLRRDPAARIADAGELGAELRRVRSLITSANVSTLTGLRPVRPRPRFAFLAATAVALAALAAAVALAPSAWKAVRARLAGDGGAVAQHIAVLPFTNVGGEPAGQAFCDGLAEDLSGRLSQLERYHGSLWVVPVAELRARRVTSPGEARRIFGVNLAVTGAVRRDPGSVRLIINLVDAEQARQLASRTIDEGMDRLSRLEDGAARTLAGMLDLKLRPEAHDALRTGGTENGEAFDLYLRALGTLEGGAGTPEPAAAVALLDRAVALDPSFALAHATRGQACLGLYRATKDPRWVAGAEASCRAALRVEPDLPAAHVTLGQLHTATGRHEEALAAFERARSTEPGNPAALAGLARIYELTGRHADAEAALRTAIALKPAYWPLHSSLARHYWQRGMLAEAEAGYRAVLALTPENHWAVNNLGGLLLAAGRRGEAGELFRRSLELHPTYAAYSNLGTIAFAGGDWPQAARLYGHALALDDRDYQVWGNLGSATHWGGGADERAKEAFDRAVTLADRRLEVNPRDAEVRADVASYQAMLGRAAAARESLRAVEDAARDDAWLAFRTGETRELLGDRAEALKWLARALELGHPIVEIETAPTLAALRADPRGRRLLAEHAVSATSPSDKSRTY